MALHVALIDELGERMLEHPIALDVEVQPVRHDGAQERAWRDDVAGAQAWRQHALGHERIRPASCDDLVPGRRRRQALADPVRVPGVDLVLRMPKLVLEVSEHAHWISEGLPGLEALAAPRAGKFLFGDGPTGADVCLVPQLYNARRYNVPLDAYPTLLRADENANQLEAFAAAHPDKQEVPA